MSTLLANKPVFGSSTYQPTGSKITAHIAYTHRTGQAVDTSTTTDKGTQINSVSSGELVRSPSASTILTAAVTASLASTTTTDIPDLSLETAPNKYKRVLSPSLFYRKGSLGITCRESQEIIKTVIQPFFENGIVPQEAQGGITIRWRAEIAGLHRCYCTADLVSEYNDLSEESRNLISQHPMDELQDAINRIPWRIRSDNPGWLFLFGAQDSFRFEDMAAQSTGYTFEDEDDDVDISEWEPDEF
ncbi:hypothetical protein TWF225_001066 [Orbilia oligospora]|nr:hypothetical protein TWF225_001066 [Orbilia oligospora]KAF3237904.1 hypothetical protein TWF128_000780 [Orbilia oligospora]KAF3245574.1 hypothetical protein TWF217_010408 [Orbilia oligospora]KAF3283058.1 hypothetical protein TWF132_010444 [Orbilia oligospora]